MFRYLDKQPLAGTLAQLQEQIDRFDVIYNTERPHQALPGRITPQQAWNATPKATPPRPKPDAERHALQLLGQPTPAPHHRVDDEIRVTRIGDNGTIYARGTKFQTSRALAGQLAHVIHDDNTLTIFDARGTFIIEHAWPTPGTKYVGNGNPRGPRPRTLPLSPMS